MEYFRRGQVLRTELLHIGLECSWDEIYMGESDGREHGNALDREFMYEIFKKCLVNNSQGGWLVKHSLASTRNWVETPEFKKVRCGWCSFHFQYWGGWGRLIPGACWPVSLVSLVNLRPVKEYLQKQKEDVIWRMETKVIFWLPHVHEHVDIYVYLHVWTHTQTHKR